MSCDTSSPKIGDGVCDDDLNTRHCSFDGGDCCLPVEEEENQEDSTEAKDQRCKECTCWADYNPLKKNITLVEDYVEQPWEMCFNGTCNLKAAVFYGGQSGKLYAYKPAELDDGSWAILKCSTPLYKISPEPPKYPAVIFIPEHGDVYITGGIKSSYNYWQGWTLETTGENHAIRISPNGTTTMFPLPSTWGKDSHGGVFLLDHAYLIGGYAHYDMPEMDNCGYVREYRYGSVGADFYRIDTTGTNSSVDWDWKFMPFKLSMVCALGVDDQYIYSIGGFHFIDRERDTVFRYSLESTNWELLEQRLPDAIFAHGCNEVRLKDQRRGILTVGGFRSEGIPSRHMFFLNLDWVENGWEKLGPSVPLVESPALVYIGQSLAVIGTCHWILLDQCCDRVNNLMYEFDWDTHTWSSEFIKTAAVNEFAGGGVEINSMYLSEDIKCTNVKWPNCIQDNVNYIPTHENATEFQMPGVNKVKNCANFCQKTSTCRFWVFNTNSKTCFIKNSPDFVAKDEVPGSGFRSGQKNKCFFEAS